MAIQLPHELVWVMNLLGIPWPEINEDKVREYAQHVRTFGDNVEDTHKAATSTIHSMSEVYEAESYEVLLERWGRLSRQNLHELVDACHAAATALDVAAGVIVGIKEAILVQLTALAAEVVVDQIAAIGTFGLAEVAGAAAVEITKRVVNGLVQQIEQHIVGELITMGIAPFEEAVAQAAQGFVFKGLEDGLGLPSGSGGTGSGFRVDPEGLQTHGVKLQGFSDEISGHVATFRAATEGMSFQ